MAAGQTDSWGTIGIPGQTEDGSVHRCAFGFSIGDDLRFISHHDTLRLFRRALARARLPVRFSQGFNPQPKITIPLPRPVGIASDDETVVVAFDRPVDPEQSGNDLAIEMPPSISIKVARMLAPREKLAPAEVHYRLDVGKLDGGDAPPNNLPETIQSLLDAESLPVMRTSPKWTAPHTVDIRPFLVGLSMTGRTVAFALRVTGHGTARPAEIAGLLGYEAKSINHCIRRLSVRWQ